MPKTSLHANSTKKAPRKNTSIVKAAMASSALGRYQRAVAVGSGIPKAERPRALRIMVSKCSSAAVVMGVGDSSARAVAVDGEGSGEGTCVARNM